MVVLLEAWREREHGTPLNPLTGGVMYGRRARLQQDTVLQFNKILHLASVDL